MLYFLLSTLVLTLYIDVVLSLSIDQDNDFFYSAPNQQQKKILMPPQHLARIIVTVYYMEQKNPTSTDCSAVRMMYNIASRIKSTLLRRHNGPDSVSNHQPHDCSLFTVYSGAYQRKHRSSASLAFVWGIHR